MVARNTPRGFYENESMSALAPKESNEVDDSGFYDNNAVIYFFGYTGIIKNY